MITLILATDMARHAEIMDSFKEKVENFDYSNKEHMTLVSGLFSLLWGAGGRAPPRSSDWEPRNQRKMHTLTWSEVSVTPICEVSALSRESPPTPSRTLSPG